MKNICGICEKPYEGYGNNSAPLTLGMCCDECNLDIVIPTRIERVRIEKTKELAMKGNAPVADILRRRDKGIYRTDDTLKEAKLAVRQMFECPTDVAFTLHMRTGTFGVLNQKELDLQIKMWKQLGVKVMGENLKEHTIDGKKVWSFVAQPKSVYEDEAVLTHLCPLSMALGVMVSGVTYLAKDRETTLNVWRALGSEWINNKMD